MAKATLSRIQPLNPELIPPKGAIPHGIGPGGKQLYREVTRRSRAVPKINPETGEREFALHATTARPLYPLNKPEIYDLERLYFLESDGMGNIYNIDYHPPTEAELAEALRQQRIKDMIPKLAEALVDENMAPEEFVRGLRGGVIPAPEAAADLGATPSFAGDRVSDDTSDEEGEIDPPVEYPVALPGIGRWELSNGETFKGKKVEAIQQEESLQKARAAAKAVAEATPDF